MNLEIFSNIEGEELHKAYVKMVEDLDKLMPGVNWSLDISSRSGTIHVTVIGQGGPEAEAKGKVFAMDRMFEVGRVPGATELQNNLLEVHPQFQGRGVAAVVNRTGVAQLERLDGKIIRVTANLDMGGYTWLRKGFWPGNTGGMDWKEVIRFSLEGNDAPRDLIRKWESLTESDAKKFVMSDEFKAYKPYLLNSTWYGKADISEPGVKDALTKLGPVKSKYKPPVEVATPRDIVSRHQVHLERLKAGYAQDYEVAIRKADKDIQDVLRRLKVETLDELTRKDLKELLVALREAQAPYYVKAMDNIAANFALLATAEAAFEYQLIGTLSQAQLRKAANAYALALRQPISATGELLEPFLTDLSAREVKRVENEVMKSVAQGRTISQTVAAVRGTKRNNYQDGVLQRNWDDARTVIRTATQHVSSMARQATWVANSDIIDSYQVVATLDGKTSQQCKSLDTKVFKIGKGPMPPFHPNCRTTTVPYFAPSEFDDGATRSAEFGPVDVNTSYYEWLKQQPEPFQVDALGPTRAKLFRSGGLSAKEFSDLNLDRNFQPLTLTEMRKLNPNAFERAKI
jgi:SPP1 gp7 family putative phage head morphogenesis protein